MNLPARRDSCPVVTCQITCNIILSHVVYRISGKSRVDPYMLFQKNDDDNNSNKKNDIYSELFISWSEPTLSTEQLTGFPIYHLGPKTYTEINLITRTVNSYIDTPNGLVILHTHTAIYPIRTCYTYVMDGLNAQDRH